MFLGRMHTHPACPTEGTRTFLLGGRAVTAGWRSVPGVLAFAVRSLLLLPLCPRTATQGQPIRARGNACAPSWLYVTGGQAPPLLCSSYSVCSLPVGAFQGPGDSFRVLEVEAISKSHHWRNNGWISLLFLKKINKLLSVSKAP